MFCTKIKILVYTSGGNCTPTGYQRWDMFQKLLNSLVPRALAPSFSLLHTFWYIIFLKNWTIGLRAWRRGYSIIILITCITYRSLFNDIHRFTISQVSIALRHAPVTLSTVLWWVSDKINHYRHNNIITMSLLILYPMYTCYVHLLNAHASYIDTCNVLFFVQVLPPVAHR